MFNLSITKKKFTNEENEELEFYRLSTKVDDTEVIFNASKQDKSLLSYILASMDVTEEGIEVPLTVSEKLGKFTFSCVIENEKFILQPREQDTRLVNFLFKNSLKVKV